MLTAEELARLAMESESSCLDFKREQYDLSQPGSKGCLALVKDILCMANTPRDVNAYILTGVAEKAGQPNTITGIKQSLDDSRVQDILRSWLEPTPSVIYDEVSVGRGTVGVFNIPPDQLRGPFYLRNDLKKPKREMCGDFLHPDRLYYRRGTTNDFARPSDKQPVLHWFESAQEGRFQDWELFKESCDHFDDNRHYVLITSSLPSLSASEQAGIAQMGWSAVIDFDVASDETGLLAASKPIPGGRHIVRVVKGECPDFHAWRNTYWFFAQGLKARSDSLLASSDWREWRGRYGSEIESQITHIVSVLSSHSIRIVVLWNDDFRLRQLAWTLETALSLVDTKCIVVSDAVERIKHRVGDERGVTYFDIPLDLLASSLAIDYAPSRKDITPYALPAVGGSKVTIPDEDRPLLDAHVDLIHLGLGAEIEPVPDSPDSNEQDTDFLRGGKIKWHELDLNQDAERDITNSIKRRVDIDLRDRDTQLVYIAHRPGAGGTTVARRVAWDLHRDYPCVEIVSRNPVAVADRVADISKRTRLAVLALADSAIVAEREVEDLYRILQTRNTACVVLYVTRRQMLPKRSERRFRVPMRLSRREMHLTQNKFATAVPKQQRALQQVVLRGKPEERTAFFLGLTAYGSDYQGLNSYVSSRTHDLTDVQKDILVYYSVAFMYGQKGVTAQAFSSMLGQVSGDIRIEDIFAQQTSVLDLMIRERDNRVWRPIHSTVAEEVLRQVLSPPKSDDRVWKQHLSETGKNFINFCKGSHLVVGEQMMELLRRVFIDRDTEDELGREVNNESSIASTRLGAFSQFIQDIPAREGRLGVLKYLAAQFPKEAHYWAHLGRFQSDIMQDYPASLEAADKAIELQPNDSLLWHMKGMSFRRQAEAAMDQSDGALLRVAEIAMQASECFEEARRIRFDHDHAYISEIQLLTRLLDYTEKVTKESMFKYFRRRDAIPYIRDAFDKAESLLALVRSNREGHGAKPHEQRCKAAIRRLYGDYQEALSIWDSLLSRNDVHHPPVRRQIVYAHVSKNESWKAMPRRNRDRCISLLEANLDEQPYNERDLRLWLQAMRFATIKPSLDDVIEKVSYWKANSNSLDATYYLYVLHSLKALDGLAIERDFAERYRLESANLSRNRRNRLRSFEWLGDGNGISKLVHQSALGNWNPQTKFWSNTRALERVDGVVKSVRDSAQGTVHIQGLDCFFVPGFNRDETITEAHINRRVSFYLGFSYSGIRAWNVSLL